MNASHSDPSPLSISALERGIDELAERVPSDVEPTQFLRELLGLLVHTARADEASVWLRTSEDAWTRLTLSVSQRDGSLTSERVPHLPNWITEALTGNGMTVARFQEDSRSGQRITGPVRQAGQATGVLAAQFDGNTLPVPAATLVPFCGALSELTGDFLVQHELRRLRQERSERQQWERWETTLTSASRSTQIAGIIAHDGRALCQADRITVLQCSGQRLQAVAVSGVETLDPRSSTLQALEGLAQATFTAEGPLSFPAPELTNATTIAWDQLVSVAGTQAAVVVPLRHPRGGILGTIIAERFTPGTTIPEAWQQQVARLATTVTPWWAALAEAERSTWNRWFSRGSPTRSPRIRRWTVWSSVALAALIALAIIPAPLVIHAEGEMVPVERRDVFATANGIVETVSVRHADHVTLQQPLVRLRDPAIELEAARVTGELATVRARLSTVQAARITPVSSAAETTLRLQQLAGEEEDLKHQRDSLTRQNELLDAERAAWNLTSPIAGQVLTWDVETLLAGRPVERGQVLLTIGNTAGDWEITARVRERHVGHLFAARVDPNGLPVEFVSSTEPGRTLIGRVENVARVAEINDRGESTVRVTIAFDRRQLSQLRPGATVWPRIQCGHRPLGYVWFHDLIDAVRRQWWLWR